MGAASPRPPAPGSPSGAARSSGAVAGMGPGSPPRAAAAAPPPAAAPARGARSGGEGAAGAAPQAAPVAQELGAAAGGAAPRRQVGDPPPEAVLVPPRPSLAQLRRAAQKAFRRIYCMLDAFVVRGPTATLP